MKNKTNYILFSFLVVCFFAAVSHAFAAEPKYKFIDLGLQEGDSRVAVGVNFTVTATKFKSQLFKRSVDIELDHYHKLSVELAVLGVFYHEIMLGDLIEITEEYSIQHMPGKAKFVLTNLSTGKKFSSFGEQITSRWIPDEINHNLIYHVLKLTHDYCHDSNHWDYWTDHGCWDHIIRTIGQPYPEVWEVGDQILFIARPSDNVWLRYNLRSGTLNETCGACPVDAILDDTDHIIWSSQAIR